MNVLESIERKVLAEIRDMLETNHVNLDQQHRIVSSLDNQIK